MRLLLVFLFILSILELEAKEVSKLQITAKNFKADDKKKTTVFSGDVVITKEKDKIKADMVIVNFDLSNKPKNYIAKQNVKFIIHLKKSSYEGSCKYLQYNPKTKIYILKGEVKITEYPESRKISASKVIIDTVHEKSIISGSKNKPVKFIFDIKE